MRLDGGRDAFLDDLAWRLAGAPSRRELRELAVAGDAHEPGSEQLGGELLERAWSTRRSALLCCSQASADRPRDAEGGGRDQLRR